MNERPTAKAHRVISGVVNPGDLVVDATAGNGHDTLFLAELVGGSGRVVAFDVQAQAIDSTRCRVDEAGVGERVELLEESHARLLEHLEPRSAAAVMFNLGYLPGGDHSLTTEGAESGKAVVSGVQALRPGGAMTVVCYIGHPGGDVEAAAVVLALEQLVSRASGGDLELEVGQPAREKSPFLVVVRKRTARDRRDDPAPGGGA